MAVAGSTRQGSMRGLSRSVRIPDRFGGSVETIAQFEQDWRCGRDPDLESVWDREGRSLPLLSALVKVEIIARFEQGQRPSVREYLDRFPELRAADEQVISLLYEEYCLLEEGGHAPPVDRFCQQYQTWADSLASQLQYHRLLSQVVPAPSGPKPEAPAYPQPGQWFAEQFLIRRVLGAGGAGRVYLADQPAFERQVALKVSPELGREHALQGRLDHDHVMPVFSVFTDEETGLHGICMPFRPGCALDVAIRQLHEARRPVHAAELLEALGRENEASGLKDSWSDYPKDAPFTHGAAWVGLVIARALAHAHGRGVLHRDVKPANIFLAVREGPQLLDFNLAHAPSNAEQAQSARSGGTLPYMAPEQLEAFLDPDHWDRVGPAADLYALGLVMVELLTGRRPEGPNPDLALPRAIRSLLDRRLLPPASPRLANPDVPYTLAGILSRCLAPDPNDRYPSAKALAEDLERFLDDRPVPSVSGVPRSERAGRWARRHRVALSTFSLVLALACPVLVGLDQSRKPPLVDPSAFVASGNDRLRQGRTLREQDRDEEAKTVFEMARSDFEEARRLDPKLYTAYTGLAFLEGDVYRHFERSVDWQMRAIRLATAGGSAVSAEKRAELAQNLAVAVSNLFQDRAMRKPQWTATAQDIEYLETIRETMGQVQRMDSAADPVKPTTKLEMLLAGSFIECQFGETLKSAGRPREATPWYRAALEDSRTALRLASEIQISEATKGRVGVCRDLHDRLEAEIDPEQPGDWPEHESTASIPLR